MPGALLTIVILALIVRWIWQRTRPSAEPVWTASSLTNELDRLETLLLRGDQDHAASSLTQIEPPIHKTPGTEGDVLRVKFTYQPFPLGGFMPGSMMARSPPTTTGPCCRSSSSWRYQKDKRSPM